MHRWRGVSVGTRGGLRRAAALRLARRPVDLDMALPPRQRDRWRRPCRIAAGRDDVPTRRIAVAEAVVNQGAADSANGEVDWKNELRGCLHGWCRPWSSKTLGHVVANPRNTRQSLAVPPPPSGGRGTTVGPGATSGCRWGRPPCVPATPD